MATTPVREIIRIASYTVADPDHTGFSLEQKVDAVNRAVSHFQRDIDYFIDTGVISITDPNDIIRGFDLGDRATKILRVEFSRGPEYTRYVVPFIGMEQLDKQETRWRGRVAYSPEYVVVNNQNESEFIFYPQIGVDREPEYFGIIVNPGNPALTIPAGEGLLNSLEGSYFHITFAERQPVFVLTEERSGQRYIIEEGASSNVNADNADLPIRRDVADILQHYVAYSLLTTTREQSDFNLANTQLQLYNSKLAQLKESKASNYTKQNLLTQRVNDGYRHISEDNYGYGDYYGHYNRGSRY